MKSKRFLSTTVLALAVLALSGHLLAPPEQVEPARVLRQSIAAETPLAGAEGTIDTAEARQRIRTWLEKKNRPQDHPGEALALYNQKRAVSGGDASLLYDRYSAARARMDAMPRFSSRLGREVSAQAELKALGTWEALGPGNIGGRTRSLLIDPTDPQTLYAAGVSGGIWKTTNGGANWSPLADMLPNIAVSTLVMAPNDPQTLYAGTGEGFFREDMRGTSLPLRGEGIFKTEDGGATWTRLESTARNDHFLWVNKLAVSSLDAERIYAATRTGVWRSGDGGGRWTRILNPNVKGGCLDLALRGDLGTDTLFASCGTLEDPATVYRKLAAEDGGANGWEAVLSEPGMRRTTLAIAPSDPTVMYALSAAAPGPEIQEGPLHAFFRSEEGGAPGSFQAMVRSDDPVKLHRLLLDNIVTSNINFCFGGEDFPVSLGWYANTVAVDPTDPDVVWAGGIDLLRSDDGGATWGIASYWWANGTPSFVHADQHALVFDPGYDGVANQRIYSANDGGIYRTDNGRAATASDAQAPCDPFAPSVTWQALNNDYGVTQFYHGTPIFGGVNYFGGTQDNGTVFGSDFSGVNGWFQFLGGDGAYTAFDPQRNLLYASSQELSLVRFDFVNGGSIDATNGITEDPANFPFITPYTMDPNDTGRLWIGGRSLWRTDDSAENWQAASAPFKNGSQLSAVAVATGDSSRVLLGLQNGYIHYQDDALSADETTEWPSKLVRQGFVSSIAFDPADNDVAYATYAGFGGQHVWKTSNGGRSWRPIDGGQANGLPDIPVHSIVVDPNDSDRLYLGTDLGVFVSTEGGRRWAVESTGFATAVTEHLALLEQGGTTTVYAFTHGRGAWRVEVDSQN